MTKEKKRTTLLVMAANLSVAGGAVCVLGFFAFSNSYADMVGIVLLIAGLSIFFVDTLMYSQHSRQPLVGKSEAPRRASAE